MSLTEWPPRNYCNFVVNNTLNKTLRIYWGGDIWGGHQVQDIAPNSYSPISSRNVRRAGADVIFRMSIKRVRADLSEHDLAITSFGFSVPAIWDCPETTIFLSGKAESLDFFSLDIAYYYGLPTKYFAHKIASVYLQDWLCEQNCPTSSMV